MLNLLSNFYTERLQYFQKKFNRVLPFGDTVVDRWEKAKALGFGKNSSIYDSAIVFGDVTVGENVWIGPNVILDGAAAPLVIGDYCHISAGTQIYTHNTVGWCVTGGKQEKTFASVTIGSCVYIGPNCIISAGVTIGNHVIIGAQSFVNKPIPNNTAAWGNSAKLQANILFTDDKNFELKKNIP